MIITLPGVPCAQKRMKFTARGGFGRAYDPSAKDKVEIRRQLKSQYNQHFNHPQISFIFHMPIPKSIPKSLLPAFQSGILKHEKKPDVDNFIKLYLDCLDGIAFDGDQKVQLGPCVKLYGLEPRTTIVLTEWSHILSLAEVSTSVWNILNG